MIDGTTVAEHINQVGEASTEVKNVKGASRKYSEDVKSKEGSTAVMEEEVSDEFYLIISLQNPDDS